MHFLSIECLSLSSCMNVDSVCQIKYQLHKNRIRYRICSTVCACVRMFVQPKLVHWGVKQQKFDHIFKRGVIQPFANSIYSACMCTEISMWKWIVDRVYSGFLWLLFSCSFSIRYESQKSTSIWYFGGCLNAIRDTVR